MASILIKTINTTTINLSSFFSEPVYINWGDTVITEDALSHTYTNPGVYEIVTSFEMINQINDNCSFPNVSYIKFRDFKNNEDITIGNNFLNGNQQLKIVDMSEMNVISIGTGFLNNCYIDTLKLPYKENISLGSWGTNSINTNGKIFCGTHAQYYKTTSPWSSQSQKMYNTDYVYKQIYEKDVKQISINKFPIYTNGYLDLTLLPGLRAAINNGTIKTEDTLTEYVDPSTRQIFYKNTELKKQYFIYSFKYRYSFDKGNTFNHTYIYNRYFKALKVINNKLYVKSFIPETYFYFKNEEENIDFTEISNKYVARDVLSLHEDSNYIERIRYKVSEWQDKEEPNYAMGKLIFGIIDDNVIKVLNYEGDVETGFTIKIVARGGCKNLKIYSANTKEGSDERPYIWIKTDQLPNNSILNGDIITINTRVGHKSAKMIRNGQEINIMKYIDVNSTWLRIKHGPNPFYCKADDTGGSVLNLNINIIYDDLFEGI